MLKQQISNTTCNILQWVVFDSLPLTFDPSTLQQHSVNILQVGVGIPHSSEEYIGYKADETVGHFSWV